MKNLIDLFVRRPVTVIMILAAIIIAAVFSLFILPINRLPDVSVPRVTVETIYPGMTANEIRMLVTIPLEDALSPVKGLERMRSVSRDNRSLISMDFRWGIDPMTASVLVREAVDAVYPALPEGARKPMVTCGISADNANEPHAIIAVSAQFSEQNGEFARQLAEYEIRARLRRIDGVGSVVLVGGEIKEEKLSLDVPRLAALGIAPSEFIGLLAQETADVPAGNAREGNHELVVVSSGRPASTADLAKIILPVANGTLTVADSGNLASSTARRESVFVYDGKEATALEIYRRSGADPLRLSREIKKTVDEAAAAFSRDALIEIVIDSSPSLISGIKSLLISASLAAAAVIGVLFFFIRRIRYSLLVSLSIPFSAAAGICVLSITGRSLNSMSLAGLAMGIGLVSDVSVIVFDLLHRSFDVSRQRKNIADKAASIAGSSIASTLTTALVFAPILLLPGPLGSLFGDIAIALVTSVFAGWFYAQFCLPSLFGILIDKPSVSINGSLKTKYNLEKKYSHFLQLFLHKPGKVFAAALFLVFAGTICLVTRPVVFINPDEAEEIHVSVVFPSGTLLESAGEIGSFFSKKGLGLPFVETVYGRAGAEEEDSATRANIDYIKEELLLRFVLKKGVKPEKALAEIKEFFALERGDIPVSAYFPKDRMEVLLGLSSQSVFAIKGKDREELLERTELVKEALNNAAITANFRPQGRRAELRLFPDRETSAYLSVPAAQIAETLYILNEGIVATRLEIDGRPLDVRVTGMSAQNGDPFRADPSRADPSRADPVRALEQIPLKTPQGKNVHLGSLGRIERMEAESSLARLDRSDVLYADIITGKKIPREMEKIAARFSWLSGADESVFARYKNSLLIYVILVLILLYLTMGAQFESFLLPLILMMSIPFSLAGAGPALLITGSKIDSGAVLGLTALFGLVVNNSLVLYEVSNEKICAGLSPAEAVSNGASERLRAIIITTATTVFALFPLVISSMGNSQKSMACAMLGGLAVSTLLSLFAIPPVLVRFFEWKIKSEESTRRRNED